MNDGFKIHDHAAHRTAPEIKRPLHRELPPHPEYPLFALGTLRLAAEAINVATQAPVAICAQSVLAAVTLVVQPHYDVCLPGAGQRPLTGIFASVAESGERKSSVDRLALRAIRAIERRWGAETAAALDRYKINHAAWTGAREAAKRKSQGDRAALVKKLEEIGSEPQKPPSMMLLLSDTTPEAITLHLGGGLPWAGVFTAEGGVLIGGVAFKDDSRMRTAALLNILWDGDAIRRTRAGTGQTFLPGRRCSAHVMMQRVVAERLLGDAELDGIGLLARVLMVAPVSAAGTRMFRDTDSVAEINLADYDARLTALLERKLPTRDDALGGLSPIPLPLSENARRLFIAFHDDVERKNGPGGEYAVIRAFASKMPEHAGRLAAVLAIYDDPDASEVSEASMDGGIQLARHYAAEMIRMKGAAAVAPDLILAGRLLEWLQARPSPRVHLAEIYQRGLNALGSAAVARRIMNILVEHGWVTRLPDGAEFDGRARQEAWELVP